MKWQHCALGRLITLGPRPCPCLTTQWSLPLQMTRGVQLTTENSLPSFQGVTRTFKGSRYNCLKMYWKHVRVSMCCESENTHTQHTNRLTHPNILHTQIKRQKLARKEEQMKIKLHKTLLELDAKRSSIHVPQPCQQWKSTVLEKSLDSLVYHRLLRCPLRWRRAQFLMICQACPFTATCLNQSHDLLVQLVIEYNI